MTTPMTTKMRALILILVSAAICIGIAGCGTKEDPKKAFVGTWKPTSMSEDGQTIAVDDLATMEAPGTTATLTVADYGTFSVDNQMADLYMSETVKPGAFAETFGWFDSSKVKSLDQLKNVSGAITVMDDSTFDALASYDVTID